MKTGLLIALILSIGYEARAVTVDQHVGSQGAVDMHHIYVEWQNPDTGRWEPADPVLRTSFPAARVGQELPYRAKQRWRPPA